MDEKSDIECNSPQHGGLPHLKQLVKPLSPHLHKSNKGLTTTYSAPYHNNQGKH